MIKLRKENAADLRETLDALTHALCSLRSAELVAQTSRNSQDTQVTLLCFEKYFMRNGSCAGLTVLFTQTGTVLTADIVGFAGGEGLLNFSLGANDAFADQAKTALLENGFIEEME